MKYTFPPALTDPIYEAFTGVVTRLAVRFKLYKKPTDVREEAAIQNQVNNDNPGNGTVDVNHINVDIENNPHVYKNTQQDMKNKVESNYKFHHNVEHHEENLDKY